MPGLRSSQAGPSVVFPHVGDGGGSGGWHGRGVYPTHDWYATWVGGGGNQGPGADDATTFQVYTGDHLLLSLYGTHSGFLGAGNLMQFVGKTVEAGTNTGWIWNITGDGAQPGFGGGPGSGAAQAAGFTVGNPSGTVYQPGSALLIPFTVGSPADDGRHLYMGTFWDHGTGGLDPQTYEIFAHIMVVAAGANRPQP